MRRSPTWARRRRIRVQKGRRLVGHGPPPPGANSATAAAARERRQPSGHVAVRRTRLAGRRGALDVAGGSERRGPDRLAACERNGHPGRDLNPVDLDRHGALGRERGHRGRRREQHVDVVEDGRHLGLEAMAVPHAAGVRLDRHGLGQLVAAADEAHQLAAPVRPHVLLEREPAVTAPIDIHV